MVNLMRDWQMNNSTVRIMTYNIHSCVNVYGRMDAEKIAKVIGVHDPDVIALQEVESQSRRVDGLHQSRYLAEYLGMEHHFFPVRDAHLGEFGLAVMARYPVRPLKKDWLPEDNGKKPHQPRGAMWIKIETPFGSLNVINTHLSLYARDRVVQVDKLLGKQWIGSIPEREPFILCGDFNAGSRSALYRLVSGKLADVQMATSQRGYPKPTFFSFYPIMRIDHIFVSPELKTRKVHVPNSADSRTASDHLPLIADVSIQG